MSEQLKKFGYRTPKTKIYKSESHKLCQAFKVEENAIIQPGSPVYLKAGTDEPVICGVGTKGVNDIYIGIATEFSTDVPYPHKELTVMMAGFAVVYGVAGATSVKQGYVAPEKVTGSDYTETGHVYYKNSVDAEDAAVPTSFIALSPAEPGELVQILVTT